MFGVDAQQYSGPQETEQRKGPEKGSATSERHNPATTERLAGGSTSDHDALHNWQKDLHSTMSRFGLDHHEGGPQTAFNNLAGLSPEQRAKAGEYLPDFAVGSAGAADKAILAAAAGKASPSSVGGKAHELDTREKVLKNADDAFANLAGDPDGAIDLTDSNPRNGDSKSDIKDHILPALTIVDNHTQDGKSYISNEERAGQSNKMVQAA